MLFILCVFQNYLDTASSTNILLWFIWYINWLIDLLKFCFWFQNKMKSLNNIPNGFCLMIRSGNPEIWWISSHLYSNQKTSMLCNSFHRSIKDNFNKLWLISHVFQILETLKGIIFNSLLYLTYVFGIL